MASNLAQSGAQIVASPTGATFRAPSSNLALDLAQGLAQISPNLNGVIRGYASDKQKEQATKAEADALSLHGQALGDAVRDGKLEPTQNPWYIQAYKTNAAKVRGQSEVSALVEQAQSWSERNDPAAFNEKFSQALGEISQKYTDPDEAAGFHSVANPLAQQTIQSNVAYNVQRIKQEHDQDISTLATQAILNQIKLTPQPSPKAMFAAMEPYHQQWIATGGTEQQWNMLTVNATIAAAYNAHDMAEADTLLDNLSDTREGKGALSNIAGPTGNPIAEDIAQARFRISQNITYREEQETRARDRRIKAEGQKVEQFVWDTFGNDFTLGQVGMAKLNSAALAKGFTPEGIQAAFNKLSQDASSNAAMRRALMGGDPEILALYRDANRLGYSEELYSRTGEMVRTGRMDLNEAEQVIGTSTSRSNSLEAEARAAGRQAHSEARAEMAQANSLKLSTMRELKQARSDTLGDASKRLQALGDRSLLDATTAQRMSRGMEQAEGAWLKLHPTDAVGAMKAAEDFANAEIKRKHPDTKTASPPAGTGKSNPRGNR